MESRVHNQTTALEPTGAAVGWLSLLDTETIGIMHGVSGQRGSLCPHRLTG